MAINTSQLADILRPGLTTVFGSATQWSDVFKPMFPSEWLAQYKAERAKAKRLRRSRVA